MEELHGPLLGGEPGQEIEHPEVEERIPVAEVAQVDPEVLQPRGDDVAGLQVSVQAGRRDRDAVREGEEHFLVGVRQFPAVDDCLPVGQHAVLEDRGVAGRLMELAGPPRETAGDGLQLPGLFRDDAREGTLAVDALEVQRRPAAVFADRAHERGRQAEEHDGPRHGLLPEDRLAGDAGAVELHHRIAVVAVVGFRHVAGTELLIPGEVQRLGLAAHVDQRADPRIHEAVHDRIAGVDDAETAARPAGVHELPERGEMDAVYVLEVQRIGPVFRHGSQQASGGCGVHGPGRMEKMGNHYVVFLQN